MTLPAILDEATGELVRLVTARHLLDAVGLHDVTAADPEQLAEFTDSCEHLTAIMREAKATVSDELLTRLDKRGKWTARFGEFEVKAPSPTAGTSSFDTQRLQDTLGDLLDRDLIDADAALAAVEFVQPDPYYKVRPAGVQALLKRGGEVAAAIESCRVTAEPPRRVARVKRKAA